MKGAAWLLLMFMVFMLIFMPSINVKAMTPTFGLLSSSATVESSEITETSLPMSTTESVPTSSSVDTAPKSENLTWDWGDFWQNLIATFFGFLLAIVGELIVQRIIRWREKNQINVGILKELDSICEQLKQNIEHGTLFPPTIEKSYWDGIVGGTKLDLINTETWYKEVASIYSRVNEINDWFKQRSEYALLSVSGSQEDSEKNKRISKVFEDHLKDEIKEEQGTLVTLISSVKKVMSQEF